MPQLPSSLGLPVTTRQFSLLEMVSRAWGSEFQAPDHGVYVWSNGRRFDSTDQGFTGIYARNIPTAPPPLSQATAPVLFGAIIPTPPPTTLSLTIEQDYIGADGIPNSATNPTPGLLLTQLMTPTQAAQFEDGLFSTVSISGAGSPARGYWIVSGGGSPTSAFFVSLTGADGFVIDDSSPSTVTFNFDASLVRYYGGGSTACTELTGAGPAGHAINISTNNGADVNVNVSLQSGSDIGRLYGGGGGGGSTGIFGSGGGGGAGGLRSGGGSQEGGTQGGVYDPVNGGASDPDVAGGTAAGGGGTGGGLGVAGVNVGGLTPGAGGSAVARAIGVTGTTSITSGNSPLYVRGAVA